MYPAIHIALIDLKYVMFLKGLHFLINSLFN